VEQLGALGRSPTMLRLKSLSSTLGGVSLKRALSSKALSWDEAKPFEDIPTPPGNIFLKDAQWPVL